MLYRSEPIKPRGAEIQSEVYAYLHKIQNVEEKAEPEDSSALSKRGKLYYLANYSKSVSYKQKHLKKEALSLRGT